MALYVKLQNKERKSFNIPFDSKATLYLVINLEYIQADGNELEHIQEQYAKKLWIGNNPETIYSIPMPNNQRVIRWYGDIAKTILSNL